MGNKRLGFWLLLLLSALVVASGYLMAGPYFFRALLSFDDPILSAVFIALIVSPLLYLSIGRRRGNKPQPQTKRFL